MTPPRPSALPPVPGSVTSSPTEPTQVSRGSGYPLLNLEVTVGTRSNAFYDPLCDRTHASERAPRIDRKSTRLNSSHQIISYAVFCLKKKTIKPISYMTKSKTDKQQLYV